MSFFEGYNKYLFRCREKSEKRRILIPFQRYSLVHDSSSSSSSSSSSNSNSKNKSHANVARECDQKCTIEEFEKIFCADAKCSILFTELLTSRSQ
ncbi:hypothetical protein POVWA2_033750 [Plasmodium ovale wallikeri]|uniref:Uncharacterized protein n=2 Tax=Plasmodium ovale TaxID=36330 RepID=A0A1A8YYN3_PLAOA|nr:hypothetical protein POVWA1_034600 [Plasmodium ovale wallikeri]SBT37382.1 hypothetical protein POVWA2_033750 [Plasmodium ovale wallikeri]SBT77488.1 hypothetical protein POWCR01_110007600 [Plasmodium ovale]